jgi:hypothetical protein
VKPMKRALAVACASALAVPVWAVPASAQAQTGKDTGSSYAYFSRQGVKQPDAFPAQAPNLISESAVDGVSPNNLGVAAEGGQESKVSFVFFSLSDIPFGSKITRAVMTIPLAPESNADRRLNAKPTNVRACAPDDSGFGGQDGAPLTGAPDPTGRGLGYQGAPARKCDVFSSVGTASPDGKAYVFDLTGLAATWDVANDGVALTAAPGGDATFQVVFTPEATLDFDFVPPAEEPEADVEVALPEVPVDPGASFDPGASASLDAGGFDSGSFASAPSAGFDSGSAPLAAGELPAADAPVTADSPAVAARPASGIGPVEVLGLTPGFFLGGLLLLGVLALLGLILGDSRAPVTATAAARQTRLSRALSAPAGSRPSLLG